MGLPVAIPAATSAFGGAMAASTIATPALLSAAAVTAPLSTAAFTGSFVPKLLTASTGIPAGGGLFGGLSSMFSSLNSPLGGLLGDASIMDLGFGASKVLGGIQSIRQGNIMKNQYELQALQTLTEMERQQYNATVEGAARLDKLQRIQSANLAKNYARGVGGLSGSALLNQIISDQEYGKDYKMELYNIANIGSTGKVNADIYKASAKAAPIDAALDAGIKLGEAAYSYKKLYG
jgi:hypothetical protein